MSDEEQPQVVVKDFGTTSLTLDPRANQDQDDSDQDIEFEAVGGQTDRADAPKKKVIDPDSLQVMPDEGIEIVLQQADQVRDKRKGKPKRPGVSGIERKLRIETHKFHLLCLIVASRLRNDMLNDESLQGRLCSLIPLPIQNAFNTISPKQEADSIKRSRMFDQALKDLVSFWWQRFEVDPNIKGLQSRSWPQAAKDHVYTLPLDDEELTAAERKKVLANVPGEIIKTPNSLGKRALLMSGSRDIKAQIFVAVCRSLGLAARMVVSLQPIDWRSSTALKTATGFRSKQDVIDLDTTDAEASASSKTKGKARAKPKTGVQKIVKKAGIRKGLVSSAAEATEMSRAGSTTGTASFKGTTTEESEVEMEAVHIPVAGSSNLAKQAVKRAAADAVLSDASAKSIISVRSAKSAKSSASRSRSKVDGGSSGGFMAEEEYESETDRLRFGKNLPVRLRSSKRKAEEINYDRSPSPDRLDQTICPVYWVEVYSRSIKEWVPVDVTRKAIRCASIMEPTKANPINKMAYVVAIEEDGSVRDVTARYVKSFGASTLKTRAPLTKGDGDWWDRLLEPFKRQYALDRDAAETEQLQRNQLQEAMPANLNGFKDHPLYVLERHIKREEALHPRKQLGFFREEPVFPRSSVVAVKSADAYMREGLQIREGEQPMKAVPSRAATINKRRALEQAKADGREEDTMQGLYARWQTEPKVPPPIVDGKVPKNSYGNLDLFAPHMLPAGGVHLPFKGIAKVAKTLGIEFAEAITGFEFIKRRAVPIAEGIVVAAENEEIVKNAYWETEANAVEKAFTKKQERCLKRWKKLITGLAIRNRLQTDYAVNGASASRSFAKEDPAAEFIEQSQFNASTLTNDIEEVAASHPRPAEPEQKNLVNNKLPTKQSDRKRKSYTTVSSSDVSSDDSDDSDDDEADFRPAKRTRGEAPARLTRSNKVATLTEPRKTRSNRVS